MKGVYKDKQFTHHLSTLLGCPMQVETQDDKCFEGIFVTWSANMDVVLEQAHAVKNRAAAAAAANSSNNASAFATTELVRKENT